MGTNGSHGRQNSDANSRKKTASAQQAGFWESSLQPGAKPDNNKTEQRDSQSFNINKISGWIDEWQFAGENIITEPLALNIWQAPTDNDVHIKKEWHLDGLNRTQSRQSQIQLTKLDEEIIRIDVQGKLSAAGAQPHSKYHLVYTFLPPGELHCHLDFEPVNLVTRLPRLGFKTRLNQDYSDITWYGRGPHESYADRKDSAFVDVYQTKIKDLFHPYLRPRENGNRSDVRWLSISGQNPPTINITGQPLLNFSLHYCSLENLTKAEHTNEINWEKAPYLYIDFAQTGLGSNACGPDTLPQYQLKPKRYEFDFTLSLGEMKCQ
ncbi:MAG: beta-galactosidase small subunit [Chloroflexota bacterium]|nr:beta-galactosidase small subunit [Chloroflexota bacterium]